MSQLPDAFEKLMEIANRLNKSHWAETGNNSDQESAMIAALYIKIETLENDLAKYLSKHGAL